MADINYDPFNDVTDPDAAVAGINASIASLFPPSALNPFVTLDDLASIKQMNTARILGRYTAGIGAVEEITIGANLTLSVGGVLSASGGGGGGTLAATLILGNTTGANDIIISAGQVIKDAVLFNQLNLNYAGGAALTSTAGVGIDAAVEVGFGYTGLSNAGDQAGVQQYTIGVELFNDGTRNINNSWSTGTDSMLNIGVSQLFGASFDDYQDISIQENSTSIASIGNLVTAIRKPVFIGAKNVRVNTGVVGSVVLGGNWSNALLTASNTVYLGNNVLAGNASTTSQRLVRIGQGTSFMDLGSLTVSTSEAAIYFNQVTPNNSNYSLKSNGTTGVTLNAPTNGNLILAVGNVNYMIVQPNTFQFLAAAATASANTPYTFTIPNSTNQGSTQEKIAFRIAASAYNWLAGNIALQRHVNIESIQYSATGASIITDAVMFQVAAATTDGSFTFTRNWAARLLGNVAIGDRLFIGDVAGTTAPTAIADLSASTITRASLRVRSGIAPTAPNAGDMWYDGTDMYLDNGALTATTRQKVARVLTAQAPLNFPPTGTLQSSDLTIAVTGATPGDHVALGTPNGSVLANSCYTAWVSGANTVTVRFNNYSTGLLDPGNGVFRVMVFKN